MKPTSSYQTRLKEGEERQDALYAFIKRERAKAVKRSGQQEETGLWRAYYTGMRVGIEKIEHYLKGGRNGKF